MQFDLGGQPSVLKGAELSDDGVFRFRLWRLWEESPPLTFIMLNPSTADATLDDPTIRRCMGFARREGYGGIEVLNLFPFRTHKPKYLVQARDQGVDIAGGERGFELIAKAFDQKHERKIVAAWGAHDVCNTAGLARMMGEHPERGHLWCLGKTASGAPRHPLYVRADAPLVPWP